MKKFTENLGKNFKLYDFLNFVMTFWWNFDSVLMWLSGISIKMFAKILLELWKYFEKLWGDFGYIL